MNAWVTVIVLATSTAHAGTVDLKVVKADEEPAARDRHWTPLLLETVGIFGLGIGWYFREGTASNADDMDLGWNMSALGGKLTGKHWRFDDNGFITNAIKHPVVFGAPMHALGRLHGLSLAEAFLFSSAVSATWEVAGEWAEYGSLNDLLSTSTAGTPIGEAFYQMVKHPRRTVWEVHGGTTRQNGTNFQNLGVRGQLDTIPGGGGEVANNHGTFIDGHKVSFALNAPFDEEGVRAWEFDAKLSFAGWYRNRVDQDRNGYNLFIGASAAFDYRHELERPDATWDTLANTKLGPTIELDIRRQGVTVSAGVDVSGDFAMVKPQGFAEWRLAHAEEIVRGALQDNRHNYYYALGVTVAPRISVSYGGLTLAGKLARSYWNSIDGDRDRWDERITADVTLEDHELRAKALLAYEIRNVTLTVEAEHHVRSGSVDDVSDSAVDRRSSANVGYRF